MFRRILIFVAVWIGFSLLYFVTSYTVKTLMTPAESETVTTEDTYMGMTRQMYLDKASNNGQDTATLCSYTYLIDTYSLEETFKMDYRASKDENDIDQRIYDAIDRCVQ